MAKGDFSQVLWSFETVQCIISSILCPSIFRQIAAILMDRRFSTRQMPLLRFHMYLGYIIQEYFIVE
jgi:hypothetical protein